MCIFHTTVNEMVFENFDVALRIVETVNRANMSVGYDAFDHVFILDSDGNKYEIRAM